ncbi:NUDIX domain-containing protein [Candidatus Roizmanbacteria bacterium]|nr:NUDIX domain-containing protein [Candidatus Roizmanbacteria bacterium]
MNTTDPQDELFPIVDEEDNVIGSITRREAHRSPHLIHRASAVLIYNQKGEMLIQKRSMTKDTFPGCWAYSVGGHVGYGENYLEVAVRETKEEIGVDAKADEFRQLGKIRVADPAEQEMMTVYELTIPDETLLKPHPQEVAELRHVDKETFEQMLKTEKWTDASIEVFHNFPVFYSSATFS